MKTLSLLVLAAAAIAAPALSWGADPCAGWDKKGFTAAPGDGYSQRDFKDACEEIFDNAGYARVPQEQRLAVVQTLARALRDGRAQGKYKKHRYAASVIVKTEEDAKKASAFIRAASWTNTTSQKVPGEPVYTPDSKDINLTSLFPDNESEASGGDKEKLEGMIKGVLEAIRKPSTASGVPGRIRAITIFASCSRFPNSGSAAGKTFEQLAKARALSAARMIAEARGEPRLSDDQLAEEYEMDVAGLNGDGSSGPASPFDDPKQCGEFDPVPDELLKACGYDKQEPTKEGLVKCWMGLSKEVREGLRKEYYDPAKYVKVRVDYETVASAPTMVEIQKQTPLVALVNLNEAERPPRPSKPPKWKPVAMRFRGRTDCVNPNKRH